MHTDRADRRKVLMRPTRFVTNAEPRDPISPPKVKIETMRPNLASWDEYRSLRRGELIMAATHRHIDTSAQLATGVNGSIQVAGDSILNAVQARDGQTVLARVGRCPNRRPSQGSLRSYHGYTVL